MPPVSTFPNVESKILTLEAARATVTSGGFLRFTNRKTERVIGGIRERRTDGPMKERGRKLKGSNRLKAAETKHQSNSQPGYEKKPSVGVATAARGLNKAYRWLQQAASVSCRSDHNGWELHAPESPNAA